MFEVRDTTGALLFQAAELDKAEQFFEQFSVPGDYIWDNEAGAIAVANVKSLIEK